tara:strand:+ start:868 stop:4431 length:3564 start_codon:yes stop_codon:yes gene_type:complete
MPIQLPGLDINNYPLGHLEDGIDQEIFQKNYHLLNSVYEALKSNHANVPDLVKINAALIKEQVTNETSKIAELVDSLVDSFITDDDAGYEIKREQLKEHILVGYKNSIASTLISKNIGFNFPKILEPNIQGLKALYPLYKGNEEDFSVFIKVESTRITQKLKQDIHSYLRTLGKTDELARVKVESNKKFFTDITRKTIKGLTREIEDGYSLKSSLPQIPNSTLTVLYLTNNNLFKRFFEETKVQALGQIEKVLKRLKEDYTPNDSDSAIDIQAAQKAVSKNIEAQKRQIEISAQSLNVPKSTVSLIKKLNLADDKLDKELLKKLKSNEIEYRLSEVMKMCGTILTKEDLERTKDDIRRKQRDWLETELDKELNPPADDLEFKFIWADYLKDIEKSDREIIYSKNLEVEKEGFAEYLDYLINKKKSTLNKDLILKRFVEVRNKEYLTKLGFRRTDSDKYKLLKSIISLPIISTEQDNLDLVDSLEKDVVPLLITEEKNKFKENLINCFPGLSSENINSIQKRFDQHTEKKYQDEFLELKVKRDKEEKAIQDESDLIDKALIEKLVVFRSLEERLKEGKEDYKRRFYNEIIQEDDGTMVIGQQYNEVEGYDPAIANALLIKIERSGRKYLLHCKSKESDEWSIAAPRSLELSKRLNGCLLIEIAGEQQFGSSPIELRKLKLIFLSMVKGFCYASVKEKDVIAEAEHSSSVQIVKGWVKESAIEYLVWDSLKKINTLKPLQLNALQCYAYSCLEDNKAFVSRESKTIACDEHLLSKKLELEKDSVSDGAVKDWAVVKNLVEKESDKLINHYKLQFEMFKEQSYQEFSTFLSRLTTSSFMRINEKAAEILEIDLKEKTSYQDFYILKHDIYVKPYVEFEAKINHLHKDNTTTWLDFDTNIRKNIVTPTLGNNLINGQPIDSPINNTVISPLLTRLKASLCPVEDEAKKLNFKPYLNVAKKINIRAWLLALFSTPKRLMSFVGPPLIFLAFFGIKKGDIVAVVEKNGETVLVPIEIEKTPGQLCSLSFDSLNTSLDCASTRIGENPGTAALIVAALFLAWIFPVIFLRTDRTQVWKQQLEAQKIYLQSFWLSSTDAYIKSITKTYELRIKAAMDDYLRRAKLALDSDTELMRLNKSQGSTDSQTQILDYDYQKSNLTNLSKLSNDLSVLIKDVDKFKGKEVELSLKKARVQG